MKNGRKEKPKFDKENSTYRQIITLYGKPPLTGYSKVVGMSERADKIALVSNWILRMFSSGYFNKHLPERAQNVQSIEYWDNMNDAHLFTLYATYPMYNEPSIATEAEWNPLYKFLESFYSMVNGGATANEIKNKLYVRGRNKPAIDALDYMVKRFSKKEHVVSYATDLVLNPKNNISPEQAKHFIERYCEKWFGHVPRVSIAEPAPVGDIMKTLNNRPTT